MYNYSQKFIEQKERELMDSIAKNYGRIREVERELANLQLQLKLTAGPKKHALELLRKKIEIQNEKVASVRAKHTAAKATYERLDAELKREEEAKDQLCGELNTLVQQAARAQLDKLEELKTHLESLYAGVLPKELVAQQAAAAAAAAAAAEVVKASAPATPPGAGTAGTAAGPASAQGTAQPGAGVSAKEQQQQLAERRRQEEEAAAAAAAAAERQRQEEAERRKQEAEAAAAAARARHVSLNPGGPPGPGAAPQGRASPQVPPARPRPAAGAAAAPAPASTSGGRFLGFDT
ncbi:hypothetical protein HYH02_003478 [Chlamydomonas schloesseri]|uniref:RAB6-interacting golgin n=1 Tax=Chlamydomonas schloesseri TaxID=2026947 RepID=A0A835WQW8_9CHLO|nr:hypothetical protein HYH02_003478 [Chlamydomonas schloesseri]|eukprot:KAG2451698.1 hypothetical protein HYH02_003478 [Chlamydomonas schloesseri]